jgi:hypothetical protein
MIGSDKFGIYETLGTLVPGTLLVYCLIVLFPDVRSSVSTNNSAINAAAFAAVVIFIGQLIQGAASFIEPALFRLWGGRPSELALSAGLGDRYLSKSSALRVRGKLAATIKGKDASAQDLFLFAMRRASAVGNSRVENFNALYSYHRSLMVLMVGVIVLMIVSIWHGALSTTSRGFVRMLFGADLVVLAFLALRTRQRAFYYVREVLLTAEHALDEGHSTKAN